MKFVMRDGIKIDRYWSFVGTDNTPIVARQNLVEDWKNRDLLLEHNYHKMAPLLIFRFLKLMTIRNLIRTSLKTYYESDTNTKLLMLFREIYRCSPRKHETYTCILWVKYRIRYC